MIFILGYVIIRIRVNIVHFKLKKTFITLKHFYMVNKNLYIYIYKLFLLFDVEYHKHILIYTQYFHCILRNYRTK